MIQYRIKNFQINKFLLKIDKKIFSIIQIEKMSFIV